MINNMIKYFVLVGLIFGTTISNLFGQIKSIQPDRPGETESPFMVATNYIQNENGFSIERENTAKKTYKYPSPLWRYGLSKGFELRLITAFQSEKDSNIIETGFIPLTIGFKVSICPKKGIIPATSFIGHIKTLMIGSNKFTTDNPAPSFKFSIQHTLSKKLSLSYNFGAEWGGETPEATYIYTLATTISVTKKMKSFLEVYGFLPQKEIGRHGLDGGLTYLLNNNFMGDLSAGIGLNQNAAQNYLSVGFSYRFKTKA